MDRYYHSIELPFQKKEKNDNLGSDKRCSSNFKIKECPYKSLCWLSRPDYCKGRNNYKFECKEHPENMCPCEKKDDDYRTISCKTSSETSCRSESSSSSSDDEKSCHNAWISDCDSCPRTGIHPRIKQDNKPLLATKTESCRPCMG